MQVCPYSIEPIVGAHRRVRPHRPDTNLRCVRGDGAVIALCSALQVLTARDPSTPLLAYGQGLRRCIERQSAVGAFVFGGAILAQVCLFGPSLGLGRSWSALCGGGIRRGNRSQLDLGAHFDDTVGR